MTPLLNMKVECETCSDSIRRTLQFYVTVCLHVTFSSPFLLLPPATKLGQGNIFRSMRGGGMHGRGHAWQGHVWHGVVHGSRCAWQGGWHAWQILRDTVNERAVRILLECILVTTIFIRITAVTHFVHYSHRHHWHNTKL